VVLLDAEVDIFFFFPPYLDRSSDSESGTLFRADVLADLRVDGRIILEWILKKFGVRCEDNILLRIGSSGGQF
jgi:hypothetical protein